MTSSECQVVGPPAFEEGGAINPGKIADYPPGVRENAGQYSHGASWLVDALTKLGELAAALGVFDLALPDFDASQFAAAEALVTACGMLAAGATLTAAMKQRAPRLRILLLLLGVALATKAITYGHQFGPERMLAWLTPGAVAGLAVGWLAVTAAATTVAARSAKALAATALALLVVVVNVVPSNPYHAHWLAGWQPGRLRDVAASSDWLAQAWPYAALAVLLWSLARRRPSPRRAADAS